MVNLDRCCAVCSAPFVLAKPSDPKRYCSKACCWVATKGPDYNARIARDSASRRGDMQRGRGTSGCYRKRNGRHEHRVVAEQMLGRPLAPGEIVHHKDGNKRNNDPANLAVMTQGEHMREHGIGIPGMTLWWEPWKYRTKVEGDMPDDMSGAREAA